MSRSLAFRVVSVTLYLCGARAEVLRAAPAFSAGADTTLVCTPSRPTASGLDTVRIRAFVEPADSGYVYEWSAARGRIEGTGADVQWLFDAAPLGFDTLTVSVAARGAPVGSCSARVLVVQPRGGRGPGDLLARAFLLPRAREVAGYGLYHYLLFGSRFTTATRARYLAALEEYVRLMPDLADFADRLGGEDLELRKEMSVGYIPVTRAPQPTHSNPALVALDRYDYARAKLLLSALPGTHRGGPYLVSVRRPLSGRRAVTREFLIQDLSIVSPPLVPAWIAQSLNDAAQGSFGENWDPGRMVLKLRTALGVLAEGVPEMKKAMDNWKDVFGRWVSWSK